MIFVFLGNGRSLTQVSGIRWRVGGCRPLFPAGETLLDCGAIVPSDMLLWWKRKSIDEMEDGVWFEPTRTLLRRKCNEEWTQEKKKNCTRHWVINGAVTQDVMSEDSDS